MRSQWVGRSIGPDGLAALLQLELLVDDALERFERLRPAERSAVDEERRRAVDAGFFGGANILVDPPLRGAAVQAGIELRGVEANLDGVLFEVRILKTRLIAEQPIVICPELALF